MIALVTGGNRGIGKAICAQLAEGGMDVILGTRKMESGEQAAQELAGDGRSIKVEQIDVADESSIEACWDRIGPVDVLVNNAGVFDVAHDLPDPLQIDEDVLKQTLAVNFHGPRLTMSRFVPAMVERGYGRVVNVSSAAGSFDAMPSGCGAAYCMSKTALNAATRLLAESVDPAHVKANVMCPGFVRSDMGLTVTKLRGGEPPPTLPEEAADTAVWLATLPPDGPSGGFFRDREPIAW